MQLCCTVSNVTPDLATPDRHRALRLENNRAIKLAALALAEERGIGRFTVEELALRADVSRRTFFNHFGSIHDATRAGLRDLLLDASEDIMTVLTGKTATNSTETIGQLFDLCSAAIIEVDFTPTIKRMCRVLGVHHREDPANSLWFAEVFISIIADFKELLESRAPHIPAITRNLMIEVLLKGVEVSAEQWLLTSLDLPHEQGLANWRALHSKTVEQLRSGFGS